MQREIRTKNAKNKTILLGLLIASLLIGCSQTDKHQNKISMTMKFRASFCDPLQPDIIELGDIEQNQIINKFESISWSDYLQKMTYTKENEIYYSPSLEVENKESKNGLAISAVGDPNNYEFYIFYKRPKKVKTLFGLKEKINQNYSTDIQGQTKNDVLECLNALIRNDTEYLSNKIGQ
jgi:hypothetical protein